MAKQKGGKSRKPSTCGLDQTLAGQTVCLAGKVPGWKAVERLEGLVKLHGGTMVNAVSPELNYLVLGTSGFVGVRKQAEKLNAKGASQIQFLEYDDFLKLLTPTGDAMIALLTGGPEAAAAGIELLNHLDQPYRLNGADLRNMRLDERTEYASLQNVSFLQADLRGARLYRTWFASLTAVRLDGAIFRDCHVTGQEFENSSLKNADAVGSGFNTCRLSGSDFSRAKLSRSDFRRASGKGPRFVRAELTDADFTQARLEEADFSQARLTGAELSGCVLTKSRFARCDLRGARLTGTDLAGCDFTGADLRDADLTGADLRGCELKGAKLKGASFQLAKFDEGAVPDSIDVSSRLGSSLQELQKRSRQSAGIDFSLELVFPDRTSLPIFFVAHPNSVRANWRHPSNSHWAGEYTDLWAKDVATLLLSLGHRFRGAEPHFDSLTVKTTRRSVSSRVLKPLLHGAICESFGIKPPDQEAIVAQNKSRAAGEAAIREQYIALLKTGPKGVEEWNALSGPKRRSAGHFRGTEFSGVNLAQVNFSQLDLRRANLERTTLREACLDSATLQGAKLAGANLELASVHSCDLREADLSGASLQRAKLTLSKLKGANLQNADLTEAVLNHADLRGADLSTALLTGVIPHDASHDEATRWPSSFNQFADLKWVGTGPNPAHQQVQQQRAAGGPIDLATFIQRLNEETDKAKLDKALSMLKADRFRLFAEVLADSVTGIVKSQGDPDLVYSCRLDATGGYACCTQNLNICGGLRGSLCKHLLVLIVGLTQAGQLDPTQVDQWIAASRLQKPVLNKELMSETFLRYKGAEAGEVDWRPTETIPEDYYTV